MTDVITAQNPFSPGNIPVRWKDLGDGTYAHNIAAHLFGWDSVNAVPVRIGASPAGVLSTTAGGGGSGGTGGVVQQGARDATGQAWFVDGSAVTQPISAAALPLPAGASSDATVAAVRDRLPTALVGGRLDVNIGASGTIPVSGTFWQATQPVSIASMPSTPVTGTFWQATQPVSGTFWQATQPISAVSLPLPSGAAQEHTAAGSFHSVQLTTGAAFYDARAIRALTATDVISAVQSGTWTVAQGTPPWAENITQVGGAAIALKAVPTNADGQAALPVYVNAIQYATYDVAARNLVTAALTANTAKALLSIEHGATSTKTVRIRRIMVHAMQTTALAGMFDIQITKGTAASTAGTAITPNPRRGSDPAAECVVKSLPTIVAATVGDAIPAGGFATTTTLYSPPVLVYDWQEAGETKALMLRPGVLESIVINAISPQALNLTMTISVDLSEE